MTAALTETVSGRTIPRYRGEPVTHDIQFTPADPPDPGYRLGGTVAQGPCGFPTVLDGGHSAARLAGFARWHQTRAPSHPVWPPPGPSHDPAARTHTHTGGALPAHSPL